MGKVVCAVCDGQFAALERGYLGCQRARRGKGCGSTRAVRRRRLEAMVMDALAGPLMQPDRVAPFCKAFAGEWSRANADASAGAAAMTAEDAAVNGALEAMVAGSLKERAAPLQDPPAHPFPACWRFTAPA